MFIKDNDDNETCTITIKNVPKEIKALFDNLSRSPTNDFQALYGKDKNLRKANMFTHMVIAKGIEHYDAEYLRESFGVALDSSTVERREEFLDVFPEFKPWWHF